MSDRKKAITALKTSRGQIDGILQMLEDDRYCIDIANQIMAAQSMLARANKLILIQHMHGCVLNAGNDKEALKEKTEELAEVFNKLLK